MHKTTSEILGEIQYNVILPTQAKSQLLLHFCFPIYSPFSRKKFINQRYFNVELSAFSFSGENKGITWLQLLSVCKYLQISQSD